jgi:hypothetical protein
MTMITMQITMPTIPAIFAATGFRDWGWVETGWNFGPVAVVGAGSDIGQARMLIWAPMIDPPIGTASGVGATISRGVPPRRAAFRGVTAAPAPAYSAGVVAAPSIGVV